MDFELPQIYSFFFFPICKTQNIQRAFSLPLNTRGPSRLFPAADKSAFDVPVTNKPKSSCTMIDPEKYAALHQKQRTFFDKHLTREIPYRLSALRRLRESIEKHEADLTRALQADLGKAPFESYTSEIGLVLKEIGYLQRHLARWATDRRRATPLLLLGSRSRLHYEPRGTVLIIAPWNYPFNLSLMPLVGAIAAGNCAVVKPSGEAPHTAACLQQLIGECFEESYIAVTEPDLEVTDALLSLPWDYIFYTGSQSYGRHVMEAASRHLTPLTLELGGKSPCIVDNDADLRVAAQRIVWGKLLNAGQTCVAPDTLFVHKEVKNSLVEALIKEIKTQYGPDPRRSPDYPHIVNTRHFDRLAALLPYGDILHGGSTDRDRLYIELTLIEKAPSDSPLMTDEIFGPILPIVPFERIDLCLEYIRKRPTPLALYYFTSSRKRARHVVNHTASGGVCINDTVIHVVNSHLPFGGVGQSGMGAYHGRYSFELFSHAKPVMSSPAHLLPNLKCAPYGDRLRWIKWLFR